MKRRTEQEKQRQELVQAKRMLLNDFQKACKPEGIHLLRPDDYDKFKQPNKKRVPSEQDMKAFQRSQMDKIYTEMGNLDKDFYFPAFQKILNDKIVAAKSEMENVRRCVKTVEDVHGREKVVFDSNRQPVLLSSPNGQEYIDNLSKFEKNNNTEYISRINHITSLSLDHAKLSQHMQKNFKKGSEKWKAAERVLLDLQIQEAILEDKRELLPEKNARLAQIKNSSGRPMTLEEAHKVLGPKVLKEINEYKGHFAANKPETPQRSLLQKAAEQIKAWRESAAKGSTTSSEVGLDEDRPRKNLEP